MIDNLLWQDSIAADRKMTEDPEWADSPEGQCFFRIVEQENERLKRLLEGR